MVYKVFWADEKARKSFERLSPMLQPRVLKALQKISDDPRPAGSKKLQGRPAGAWRVRIGDYRLIYDIDDKAKTVVLIDLGPRRNIYR